MHSYVEFHQLDVPACQLPLDELFNKLVVQGVGL
jgi:hypothetical protein